MVFLDSWYQTDVTKYFCTVNMRAKKNQFVLQAVEMLIKYGLAAKLSKENYIL